VKLNKRVLTILIIVTLLLLGAGGVAALTQLPSSGQAASGVISSGTVYHYQDFAANDGVRHLGDYQNDVKIGPHLGDYAGF
jgi:hypothetical protein